MAICRQVVDNIVDNKKQRDGARYAVPLFVFGRQISPLSDVIHDRCALVSPSIEMCKCLKSSLLVANRHECLAVDDGCAHLDAVIFAEVYLVHINLLLIGRQVFAVLVLRDRSDDGAVCLFPCRPR